MAHELVPEALDPRSTFYCERLHGSLPAWCCLMRQSASRRCGTADTWRGQASMFPSCGPSCSQGAAVRAAVDGAGTITWRGAGPGGRHDRGRPSQEHQLDSRRRLASVGLLDLGRTCDGPISPGPPEP